MIALSFQVMMMMAPVFELHAVTCYVCNAFFGTLFMLRGDCRYDVGSLWCDDIPQHWLPAYMPHKRPPFQPPDSRVPDPCWHSRTAECLQIPAHAERTLQAHNGAANDHSNSSKTVCIAPTPAAAAHADGPTCSWTGQVWLP